jgi:hypothetical protein
MHYTDRLLAKAKPVAAGPDAGALTLDLLEQLQLSCFLDSTLTYHRNAHTTS